MEEAALLSLCQDLLERAARAGADQAEAIASWHRGVDTNLENGRVHTVQTSDETVFGLRVFVDGSLGFVTANNIDGDTLDGCIAEAVAQAKATPADPLNHLPAAAPTTPVADLYDERIASIDVGETTRVAVALLERVRSSDKRIRVDSGAVGAACETTAIASSEGIALSERCSSINGYLFGMAVDGDEVASFDYDGDACRKLAEFPALLDAAADRFAEKCLAGLGAAKGKSYNGSVVLSPEAVGEFLLPNLIAAMSADAVRKGRSALAGKLGEQITTPGFTLVDDGSRPGGIASSAFDREGVPIGRHVLVDNGVLQTYLYNHYEACAAGEGVVSTGHAAGSSSSLPGIGPTYLELAAGDSAAADLTGGDGPCVFVGRFSGSTNAVTGDFSGVVKNGYLEESGSRRPLRETLIAGNLFDMLKRISAISVERRLVSSNRLVPALRVEGISVTAG